MGYIQLGDVTMIELSKAHPRPIMTVADITESQLREYLGLKQRLIEVAKPGEGPCETLDRIIRLSSLKVKGY